MRQEDASLFVAHILTNSPPSEERLNPTGAAKFADAIYQNFQTHLGQLDARGEAGSRKKRQILTQLSDYVSIFSGRSPEDTRILDAYARLSREMNGNPTERSKA